MSPDAQAVLKRLEAYGAETVYVQDQKDWDRSMFVEYASKVEKTGPEPFEVNPEFLKEAEEAEVDPLPISPRWVRQLLRQVKTLR